jgi:hypothetical protein
MLRDLDKTPTQRDIGMASKDDGVRLRNMVRKKGNSF